MKYRFEFRRYALPFRRPVRTAHRMWAEREGIIVRGWRPEAESLAEEQQDGVQRPAVSYGEVAPLPEFGTETIEEGLAGCHALGPWIDRAALDGMPARLGCLRSALHAVLAELENGASLGAVPPAYLSIAALLPAGRAAIAEIQSRLEAGFRVFKWKVGADDIANELGWLDDICAALPSGARLRLDANGAWDRRKAERWLERCAERPIEFVEQPCFAQRGEGAAVLRRTEDMLLGLADDYPTPIALDESLVGERDVERWVEAGWPGVFVVKPSLMGDLPGALARLEKAKASVVFSSALETAVGARVALRAAFAWREPRKDGQRLALGFGVWPLFADARFDGPAAAPFIRGEDLHHLDPAAIWTALS